MKFEYLCALLLLATPAVLHADWKEDVGFYRLQQTFTSGVPTAVAAGVTQAEAPDLDGNFYLPDDPSGPAHPEFVTKTLINKSSGTGVSGHASMVGALFYGNNSSLIPATTSVDAYDANGWIQALPAYESRRVQNHSWIAIYDRNKHSEETITSTVAVINQRLDVAINRDGFISVAGANNGASTTLPDLLVQGYNSISVGLVNGAHSAGLTVHDGPGRMKPDIVSFDGVTSNSTPQVASAAGLLSEKLRNTHSATLATADYPRLTKALLLAGAIKEPFPAWSRASSTAPYDAVFGAGALNVLLSYRILDAGRQLASNSSTVAATGWDHNNASAQTGRRYFFEIPAGSVATRFSAALTWHRLAGTSLANLDLRLYSASGTALGEEIDASVSSVDNVEHLYQATLPPGRYALVVTLSASDNTDYALAWRSSPTVNVTATTAVAREIDATPAVFTLTRSGPTTSPLLVPLTWGGSAVSGIHYATPPTSVLIPAGENSTTVMVTPIPDDLAQGERTVTLSIGTDYSLSAGTAANAIASIEDKPYDSWRFIHFDAQELTEEAVSGPQADPDADGIPNLLEYALNALPKSADNAARLPSIGIAAGHLTLSYTRPTTMSDINYVVQWSPDLVNWSTGPGVTELIESIPHEDDTTTLVTRAIEPLDTTPRQFLRLRVTRLPDPGP